LLIAVQREGDLPLWSIPAMTLFTFAGLTLLCVLLVAGHRTVLNGDKWN